MTTKQSVSDCRVQPAVSTADSSVTHDQAPRVQHVQPGVDAYREATREALDYLNAAIRQLSSSPNLYTTKTTAAELQKTADYLAQIKLEEELFRNSSPGWRERFSERELVTQRQAVLRLKQKLTDSGGQFIARYRTNMDFGNVRCTSDGCATQELTKRTEQDDGIGWTDTAVRAAHAWAERELVDLNRELEPLARESKKRMEQYMDEMDITDRYSNYRRNLGCLDRSSSNDQKALETVLDSSIRPSVAPRWNLGSDWMRSEAVGTQNYTVPGDRYDCHTEASKYLERNKTTVDPRTSVGLMLKYPGRTEYQDAYMIPTFVETGMDKTMPPATHRATFEQPPGIRGRGSMVGIDPAQVQNKGYGINPKPDFLRDFDRSRAPDQNNWVFPKSETTTRYTWPNTSKTVELPLVME